MYVIYFMQQIGVYKYILIIKYGSNCVILKL